MKIFVNVTHHAGDSGHTIIENVTTENMVPTLEAFFTKSGIHLAEELAIPRSKTLIRDKELHMFDHAKLIDYKFQLADS